MKVECHSFGTFGRVRMIGNMPETVAIHAQGQFVEGGRILKTYSICPNGLPKVDVDDGFPERLRVEIARLSAELDRISE